MSLFVKVFIFRSLGVIMVYRKMSLLGLYLSVLDICFAQFYILSARHIVGKSVSICWKKRHSFPWTGFGWASVTLLFQLFPDSVLPHASWYIPSKIFIKHKSDVTALIRDIHIFNWLVRPSPPVIIQLSSLISHHSPLPITFHLLGPLSLSLSGTLHPSPTPTPD